MAEISKSELVDRLNPATADLLESYRDKFDFLGIETKTLDNGAELINFGCTTHSGAGELLANICMADLAQAKYLERMPQGISDSNETQAITWVSVETAHPLIACMAAQYAGWPLSVGKFFAMCSGPARSARGKEKVLEEYQLTAAAQNAVAVLECRKFPDESVAEAIAEECDVPVDQVKICVAPTSSLAGTIQIVGRSVETAIHKLHELKFDLNCIKSGKGEAPSPPIQQDDLVALGWTNDAVLYGAVVELTVDCEDAVIEEVGPKVPSNSSSDFGTPFLEIFERFERDFYKIDKMLFSPAKVVFKNLRNDRTFEFGEQRFDILDDSWKRSSDD